MGEPDEEEGRRIWRLTRFHPIGGGGGPFRTAGLAMRLVRLSAGCTQREVGNSLGLDSGTIEAIERGSVVPTTQDVERWFETCGPLQADMLQAGQVAERLWPADQPVLELPQFWGAGVPSAAEFQAARELIESLREGPLLETRTVSVDPEAWLARFFAPVDEFERVEERPLGASWRLDPVLAFNRFLAAQAPVGVRFLPIEEDVQ